jgi:hypothetical protein
MAAVGQERRIGPTCNSSAHPPLADTQADRRWLRLRAISGREQCDPGQSILVAPIAGRYDEAGDRDRVAIAGARWDL